MNVTPTQDQRILWQARYDALNEQLRTLIVANQVEAEPKDDNTERLMLFYILSPEYWGYRYETPLEIYLPQLPPERRTLYS